MMNGGYVETISYLFKDDEASYGDKLSLKDIFTLDNYISIIQINGRLLDFRYSEERIKIHNSQEYEAQLKICQSTQDFIDTVFKPNKKVDLKFPTSKSLDDFKTELSKSISRYTALPKQSEISPTSPKDEKNIIAKTQGKIPAKNTFPGTIGIEKDTSLLSVKDDYGDYINKAIEFDESGSSSSDNDASESNDELEEHQNNFYEVVEPPESPDNRKSMSQFVMDPEIRLPKAISSSYRYEIASKFHSTFSQKPMNSVKSKSTWMTETEFQMQLNKRNTYRQIFRANMSKISTFKNLNIRVLSWNINSKVVPYLNLDDWVHPEDLRDIQPDIFVFGFQEVDLSFGSVALNKTSSSLLEDRWVELIESACDNMLNQKYQHVRYSMNLKTVKYKQLKRVRMAGILLIIYLSKQLKGRIFNVSTSSTPTGIMNMMGNKGAVGVRFNYYNSSFCVVNCHLAAGEGNIARRIQDLKEIMQRLTFNSSTLTNDEATRLNIANHDYIILFGDLNFRLNTQSSEDVLNLIDKKDYKTLLNMDEIRTQTTELSDFREAEIKFPPTYKFMVGTQRYDTGEKGRIPAYCDRILYKGEHIQLTDYRAHQSFVNSDHKPISAMLTIGAYKVNRNYFSRYLDDLVHKNDIELNKMVPKASLEPSQIEFEDVEFFKDVERQTVIRNTGNVDLEYEFKNDNELKMPSWLTVCPRRNILKKGESNTISITIGIKDIHVQEFNKIGRVNGLLIVRLQDGGDAFISVSFNFKPTCFGLSLKMLNRLGKVPFGTLSSQEAAQLIKDCEVEKEEEEAPLITFDDDGGYAEGQKNFQIPKEIYRMTSFIAERVRTPYLYDRPQTEKLFYSIHQTLNNTPVSEPFNSEVDVHTMIAILNIFLSTIKDAAIPMKFQAKFLETSNDGSACVGLIKKLPIVNQNLVCYILQFLRFILKHSSSNGSDSDVLAKNYAEIFFKADNDHTNFDQKVVCLQKMIEWMPN